MFTRSTDRGVTWSAPVRINDDAATTNAWQWFGTMSVAPDGRIDVVFNDTRNSGQVNLSQTMMTYSLDGGQTWSTNVAITPQWNSFLGWPNQNKIGDYYDMVSDVQGAHLAYSATFNGEQDVYYAHIAPDCNGNGRHDGSDILSGFSIDRNSNLKPDDCDADFDTDGDLDLADIDALVAAIASGAHNPRFNLTEDGLVTVSDRDAWLGLAGGVNLGSGISYLLGDANLDRFVDGVDFNIWNANNSMPIAAWSRGDFTANGVVNNADFDVWYLNRFRDAGGGP
jgi:hypothetical protein